MFISRDYKAGDQDSEARIGGAVPDTNTPTETYDFFPLMHTDFKFQQQII